MAAKLQDANGKGFLHGRFGYGGCFGCGIGRGGASVDSGVVAAVHPANKASTRRIERATAVAFFNVFFMIISFFYKNLYFC